MSLFGVSLLRELTVSRFHRLSKKHFKSNVDEGWRWMLGLAILPALVQALGFIFLMPESARHLLESSERDKAKAVLRKIRGTYDVDDEFLKISEDINQSKSENFLSLFSTSNGRHALFVGCSLQFFQQFTGINTVMYYSATIIYMSGMVTDPQAAIWFSGFANSYMHT